MTFYKTLIDNSKTGCLSKRFHRKIYVAVNFGATLVYTVIFVLETAIPSGTKQAVKYHVKNYDTLHHQYGLFSKFYRNQYFLLFMDEKLQGQFVTLELQALPT